MTGPPASILLLDDVPDNLQVLSDILIREGFLVRPVASAAAAFRTIEARLPDLVLADIKMPGMDGYAFCRQLKAVERTRELPVIFISALGGTLDKVRAFEAGGVDYITKPFQSGEVVARVRTHLALRELRLSLSQLNLELEGRVLARTRELEDSLEALRLEVAERVRAQAQVQRMADELEQRVAERTAQLESANTELEAFSYSVSHDLRAPLRSVDGFSQALLEDCGERLGETGRNYLERIRSSGQRMGRIIDDLLKLSRANRDELCREETDLSGLCARIAADLARARPFPPVQVSIQPGMRVRGDGGLLQVLLENLLGNAWKFTSKCVSPRIQAGETVQPGGGRAFFIRDNGAGFDMAQADRLFRAFHRLHTDAEFQGTGIGLTIVQRIVRRHGGRVWAEAEPGQGAVFFFTLPDPI